MCILTHSIAHVIGAIAADNGFVPLTQNEEFIALGVTLNLTSQDEHQTHIEQYIKTIKERCRLCYTLIPSPDSQSD